MNLTIVYRSTLSPRLSLTPTLVANTGAIHHRRHVISSPTTSYDRPLIGIRPDLTTFEMEPSVEAQLEHFRSIPWCKKHLDRPDQVFGRASSRGDRRSAQYLFSKTLNTPETVPQLLVFHDRLRPKEPVPEIRALVTLGENVAGHKGICHGGVVMTLLDEVAGELGAVNIVNGAIQKRMLVTAYLNTKFLRPIMVPSTVFARSWATRAEERKYFVEAVIEDENGVALASAEAMFMAVREKGKL